RALGVAPPRGPRAELERGEVRSPDDMRELGDAQLVRVASRGEGHAGRLDPVRPLVRHALLPDDLAAGARRLPFQLAGALVERVDDPVADRDEVLDEVELGLPAGREVDLVRVRDLDRAVADLELDERRRHGQEYRSTVLDDPRVNESPIRLTLEPLDDYVVIEPTDEEAETRAGLIL